MSSSTWLNHIGRTLKTNTPAILSGIAVAGLIGTVVLAVKATPDACEAIAMAKEDKAVEENTEVHDTNLTPQELVQTTWKFYIPTGISGAASIACIVGACTVGYRQKAALAGAYALIDQNFRIYKEKVIEQITPQKADKIEDEVNKEYLHRSSGEGKEVVIIAGGDVLCMDSITGRYFRSTHEAVRKAEIDTDAETVKNMYMDLNYFYERLGLPKVDIGEELGWNIDNRIKLHFSSLLNECDVPVFVVGYENPPRIGYDKV
jgi:hypothetical protein